VLEINELKFDENGLIPCIVQDYETKKVLTLAYMNAESIAVTLEKKLTCFYSRSRKKLWLKGETSGNYQHLVSLTADCDGDALVAEVIKDGPACHTGADGCFNAAVFGERSDFSLAALYKLLTDRKKRLPENSYTSYLFTKGREKILKKVGEECSEVIIAAMKSGRDETVFEISDLCYHVMVLMADCGITPGDILKELESRQVVDKKVKQETMK
jgi:phosphoribosyl-ATP diphosphatase